MSFLQKMGVKFGKNNIPDNKSDSVATDTLLQQTLQSVQNSDFLDAHALLGQDNITLPIFGTGSVNSHMPFFVGKNVLYRAQRFVIQLHLKALVLQILA